MTHATAAPPYEELVAQWKALRGRDALTVREVACVGAPEPRTLLVAELAPPSGGPTVTVSAGVHGDEPAAPWALLSIVRDGLLDRSFGYRIWPCTNPSGYARGTRENAEGQDVNRSFGRGGETPEARAILTSNRDRTFALALDLHEDYEADGFYLYEPFVNGEAPYGSAICAALDDAGLPVQELDDLFDLGYPPEGFHVRKLERGRVHADAEAERKFFPGIAYSIQMVRKAARRVLTVETPRTRPWEMRLAMHRLAVVTALGVARSLRI